MKIDIKIDQDKKDSARPIVSSMKERTSLLKDVLAEVRKYHSISMEKMMGMIKQRNGGRESSAMAKAMSESNKMNRSMMKMNQSMISTLKSIANKNGNDNGDEIKSMIRVSNSLLEAIKKNATRQTTDKTVIVKTVNNNKSIEKLTEAIRSGSFNRSRWIPSAS